jgi:hypothetical protein
MTEIRVFYVHDRPDKRFEVRKFAVPEQGPFAIFESLDDAVRSLADFNREEEQR